MLFKRPLGYSLRSGVFGLCSLGILWGVTAVLTPALPSYADTPIGKKTSLTFPDVAPILHLNCVVCHRPGGMAPFPLLNYADVKKRSRQIAQVTHSRYMPPWHA